MYSALTYKVLPIDLLSC